MCQGRFRVRFDDWDEQLVDVDGIRLLPQGFGKRKRVKDCPRPEQSPACPASASEAGGACERAPAAAATCDGETNCSQPELENRKPASDLAVTRCSDELEVDCRSSGLPQLAERMAPFVRSATAVMAGDGERLGRLSALLERMGAGCTDVTSDMVALLRSHPDLLAHLKSVLSNGGWGGELDWERKLEVSKPSAESSCSCREEPEEGAPEGNGKGVEGGGQRARKEDGGEVKVEERREPADGREQDGQEQVRFEERGAEEGGVDTCEGASSDGDVEAESSGLGAGVHDALRGPQGKGVRELHKASLFEAPSHLRFDLTLDFTITFLPLHRSFCTISEMGPLLALKSAPKLDSVPRR